MFVVANELLFHNNVVTENILFVCFVLLFIICTIEDYNDNLIWLERYFAVFREISFHRFQNKNLPSFPNCVSLI